MGLIVLVHKSGIWPQIRSDWLTASNAKSNAFAHIYRHTQPTEVAIPPCACLLTLVLRHGSLRRAQYGTTDFCIPRLCALFGGLVTTFHAVDTRGWVAIAVDVAVAFGFLLLLRVPSFPVLP
jgi:hypothetical protein